MIILSGCAPPKVQVSPPIAPSLIAPIRSNPIINISPSLEIITWPNVQLPSIVFRVRPSIRDIGITEVRAKIYIGNEYNVEIKSSGDNDLHYVDLSTLSDTSMSTSWPLRAVITVNSKEYPVSFSEPLKADSFMLPVFVVIDKTVNLFASDNFKKPVFQVQKNKVLHFLGTKNSHSLVEVCAPSGQRVRVDDASGRIFLRSNNNLRNVTLC